MSGRLERIPAFDFGDLILFKHYFDADKLFGILKEYYNNQQYRFEIPESEIEDLENPLAEHGYELDIIRDTDPYVVVVEKYSDHPENIFKESVINRSENGYNCFLMTDQIAVAKAVDGGAVRVTNTAIENPFPN